MYGRGLDSGEGNVRDWEPLMEKVVKVGLEGCVGVVPEPVSRA